MWHHNADKAWRQTTRWRISPETLVHSNWNFVWLFDFKKDMTIQNMHYIMIISSSQRSRPRISLLWADPGECRNELWVAQHNLFWIIEAKNSNLRLKIEKDWSQMCCHCNIQYGQLIIFVLGQHSCKVSVSLHEYFWRYFFILWFDHAVSTLWCHKSSPFGSTLK